MIKVKIRKHDPQRYLRLTVEGHAGAGEFGHDLVCASSSILASTLAQIVQTMEFNNELEDKPCVELNKGDASIIFRCRNEAIYTRAKHMLDVIETGYLLLEHNHPQFVELKSVD